MMDRTFNEIFQGTFRDNWALPAMTNYDSGVTYSYAEFAQGVARVHLLLDQIGIKPGEHIAIVGKDCAEWCMAWMGVVTFGAVIVPILPDFHGEDIRNIINHSDSVAVFVDEAHLKNLLPSEMAGVRATIDYNTLKPNPDLTPLEESRYLDAEKLFGERYPKGFRKEDILYPDMDHNDVVQINYTSGTTGHSKGVILTSNNLVSNIYFAQREKILGRGESILCFLPNAHAYSCTFNFLLALADGAHSYILGLSPTPKILMKAFKDTQPKVLLSVPLVIEKIYKSIILPQLNKAVTKTALKIPGVSHLVYRKIKNSLLEAMGGNLSQFIIGGAPLSDEVGIFLTKIGFPYTVGYGMTECSPLVTYEDPKRYVPTSCGKPLKGITEVRIADAIEVEGQMVGEVQVRGDNVCKGYYKLPEATEQLFTADGWLRTGDLGTLDKKKNLYLKGRLKTMLLGPNGQNIYPEEIEDRLNMLPGISESIVVQRNGSRLVAVVRTDDTYLTANGITTDEALAAHMSETRARLNEMLPAYERIQAIEVRKEDFEKTPKQSIKRFLVK